MVLAFWSLVYIWTTLVDVGAAKLVLSLLPGTVPFPFCLQVFGLSYHGPLRMYIM